MNVRIIFGISALLSFVSAIVAARLYAWPWLKARSRRQSLASLVVPHMFLRFIGLSFLVPGVVSPSLPAAFAVPAAYGDLIAGILAILAAVGLAKSAFWSIPSVWLFNVWGAADLLYAFYEGPRSGLMPGELGAAFYLVTAIVPLLLVSHFVLFALLIKPQASV
jgi:hypothetical protein